VRPLPGQLVLQLLDQDRLSYAGNWVTGFEKAAYRGG